MWKIRKFSLQSGLELKTTHDRRSPYQLSHRGWPLSLGNSGGPLSWIKIVLGTKFVKKCFEH